MNLTKYDIVESIGMSYRIVGSSNPNIESPASISRAGENQVTFCNNSEMIDKSSAGLIICTKCNYSDSDKVLVFVDNPRLAFIRVLSKFFVGLKMYSGIHIGKNFIKQPYCTIGTEGFSYERNENGELEKFPQLGGVIIEDNVEIGAYTNIQKGTLGYTTIHSGCKIGPYCNVGHNTEMGRNTFVAGGCNFGGGTIIGESSWIGMGTIVIQDIKVGGNVMVGGGSLVVKDIGDDWLAYGAPAKLIRRR